MQPSARQITSVLSALLSSLFQAAQAPFKMKPSVMLQPPRKGAKVQVPQPWEATELHNDKQAPIRAVKKSQLQKQNMITVKKKKEKGKKEIS